MHIRRIRKNYRFKKSIVEGMLERCQQLDKTETDYLEQLMRIDFKQNGVDINKPKPEDFSHLDVEDFPGV